MVFEELKTERLILRKLTPEVYRFVHKNYSDSELSQFFGLTTTEELEKEKTKYKNGTTTYNKSFVIFHLLDATTGTFLGGCGFHTWYIEHARAEIGYQLLHDSEKGKGLMSEALGAIIDYGFNTMNLNRIEAFVGPDNTPSLKLMEKFGFKKEGVLKSHYFKNNKMENSVVFGLLKKT